MLKSAKTDFLGGMATYTLSDVRIGDPHERNILAYGFLAAAISKINTKQYVNGAKWAYPQDKIHVKTFKMLFDLCVTMRHYEEHCVALLTQMAQLVTDSIPVKDGLFSWPISGDMVVQVLAPAFNYVIETTDTWSRVPSNSRSNFLIGLSVFLEAILDNLPPNWLSYGFVTRTFTKKYEEVFLPISSWDGGWEFLMST